MQQIINFSCTSPLWVGKFMNTFIISSPVAVQVDPCTGAKSLVLTECSALIVEMYKLSSRCISQHLGNHMHRIS